MKRRIPCLRLLPSPPAIASPGSGNVSLTVSGSNFINIAKVDPSDPPQVSVVNWNSGATQVSLTATIGSASQITATVPASLLTTESCAIVTVFNPPAVDPIHASISSRRRRRHEPERHHVHRVHEREFLSGRFTSCCRESEFQQPLRRNARG